MNPAYLRWSSRDVIVIGVTDKSGADVEKFQRGATRIPYPVVCGSQAGE